MLIARYRGILDADPRETFAFRRLLDLYRARDGNIEQLIAALSAQLEADPESYAPHMLLGHVLKAQNRLEESRGHYQRAAELRAAEAAPRVALARLERGAGHHAEAIPLFDQALQRTRERVAREELLREVAVLAMGEEDFDAARGYYEQLASGGDGSLYLRTEYGRALSAARHWARAAEEYRRVLASLRGDNRVLPPVLLELARVQLEMGEVDPSIETLDRSLRLAGRRAGIRAEIYDQLLTAHRRADRLDELAVRLRAEGGRGFEANELLGRIEDELGHDELALAAFRRALRSRSRDIDTRVRIIQLLSRSGRLDEVVDEYRALIRSAPREPRFVIELAQLLMQTDHRDDALRLLSETGRRHARDANLHQQLAEIYARWGEDELSAREVELLVRIDPRDPAHLIALGAQRFDANDVEGAIRTWSRVLDVTGDRAEGHATLAGIFADHDLLDRAIEQYREAARLEPAELSHARGLATTLERDREHDEAEVVWRRVLELAADDRIARREARERIVGIWMRTRRLRSKIRELTALMQRDPDNASAGRFLAEALRRSGPQNAALAERVLDQIVEVDPSDIESLLALERIRRHRGDLAGAIDVLRRLRDADPRRASRYLQQMAEHALALYRDDEAITYAAEAVDRNPDDASGHRRLGDLFRARQDSERAIASYRRALELNERLYPVYFELAEMLLARGETSAGDQLYRRLLAITPDDDLVARAAHASIQINLGAGTLEELERDLLPLALSNPTRPIFRRVVVELYDAYAGPLVLRARLPGAEGVEARAELRRIGTRGIKPLLEALADPDPAQRRVSLDILGDLANPNAAAPLLALAESDDVVITQRIQAMRAAGTIAPPALVSRLIRAAERGDRRLRGLATWALGRMGGEEASRALRRLYQDGDETVRGFAALGLGVDDGEVLSATLGREANLDVRFGTVWAIGQTGDPAHTPALLRVLANGGGVSAEIAAAALGRIGGEAAREALVRALFTPDAQLREAAARGLRGTTTSPGATERSATLPAPLAFERVRDYVARLVASSTPAAGAPVDLAPLLPALAEAASSALAGPVEQVLAALSVLGEAEEGLGVGPLTRGLGAERHPALVTLEQALVEPLVAASAHLDGAVRVEAVRLLARIEHADADEAVARALADPPASVRRAALDALARSSRRPSDAIVAQLIPELRRGRDWSMRTRAARALGRSSSPLARVALRDALRTDDYAFVREAAALALFDGALPEDIQALETALDTDEEPRIRRVVAARLVELGGHVAAGARARAARDPDPSVREAVSIR